MRLNGFEEPLKCGVRGGLVIRYSFLSEAGGDVEVLAEDSDFFSFFSFFSVFSSFEVEEDLSLELSELCPLRP